MIVSVSADDGRYGNPDVFYSQYYKDVLCSGIVGQAQGRTHKALERQAGPSRFYGSVLELGAGSGEHFPHVRHGFDSYLETDIRTPDNPRVGNDSRRRFEIADAQRLHYEDNSFDRVIATCLLLHISEPEKALNEWRRVTRPNGLISILVPCDPGVLVRVTRQILTVPAVRKSGFEGYGLFNARDHRNHAGALHVLARHVFRNDKMSVYRYPFRINSWNLNAFTVYSVRVSDG